MPFRRGDPVTFVSVQRILISVKLFPFGVVHLINKTRRETNDKQDDTFALALRLPRRRRGGPTNERMNDRRTDGPLARQTMRDTHFLLTEFIYRICRDELAATPPLPPPPAMNLSVLTITLQV